jgi:hypothetical protein
MFSVFIRKGKFNDHNYKSSFRDFIRTQLTELRYMLITICSLMLQQGAVGRRRLKTTLVGCLFPVSAVLSVPESLWLSSQTLHLGCYRKLVNLTPITYYIIGFCKMLFLCCCKGFLLYIQHPSLPSVVHKRYSFITLNVEKGRSELIHFFSRCVKRHFQTSQPCGAHTNSATPCRPSLSRKELENTWTYFSETLGIFNISIFIKIIQK